MMTITVCRGDCCHIAGAKVVQECLLSLVEQHGLSEKVELCKAYCIGVCGNGVGVKVDQNAFCVDPEQVEAFFTKEVLRKM